jgi:hypothetical protein
MNKLLFFIAIIVLGCSKETGCVKITLKEETNGKHYFYWGNNVLGVDEEGASQPLTGSVSKEDFDAYEIGDQYCVE